MKFPPAFPGTGYAAVTYALRKISNSPIRFGKVTISYCTNIKLPLIQKFWL